MTQARSLESELEIKQAASEFTNREIIPLALTKERTENAADRVPWDIFEKASKMGFNKLAVPEEYGGLSASTAMVCMVAEEIARGDIGIAVALGHWWKDVRLISRTGTKEQKDWFFPAFVKDDRFLLSTTLTEPSYGSDWMLLNPEHNFNTTATRRGGRWSISGTKIFVSNGSLSKLYTVYATTDKAKSFSDGTSAFLVPSDTPGIRFGTVYDKMGMRLLTNAEVILEDCAIPQENMLGELNKGLITAGSFLKEGIILSACDQLGCAQRIFDLTLDYAKQRVQGGQQIIRHQAVGARLGRMATMIEACRSLIYRAARELDADPSIESKLGAMSRYFSGEVLREIATLGLETFGGAGIMLDNPIQKYVRDALASLHIDGTQDIQLIRLQNKLLLS